MEDGWGQYSCTCLLSLPGTEARHAGMWELAGVPEQNRGNLASEQVTVT
jgi:hypothetical protein